MFKSPKILKWFYPNRVWGISVSQPSVFLTFDDGPDPEITPWVLNFLKAQNIHATFFCVGTNCVKHPELFQQILSEGHAVGNHSMNHENGFKTNDTDYFHSIEKANDVIQSNLFRPPYGRMKKRLDKTISEKYKIIMWSWLSYDYDQTVKPEKIVSASKSIKSGDILVFHDNRKTKARLKEVLPPVIEQLKAQSLRFAKIT